MRFANTLNDDATPGNANLTINASGVTTFGQAVGDVQALTSLTTDTAGTTQFDGRVVRTAGDQTYLDAVTLGADATLTGVNVRFASSLNDDATPGNAGLTVNASGVTTFGQAVGGLQALTSLTTDAAGTTQLDGGVVRTTGDQTYQDAVTLGADATLTGVNVRFTNTLNDDATAGNANLTINASGVTMFDRAVGGVQALTSLTTDAAGTTQFDGGVVRTTGDQTYQDAVTLGADATLTGVNVRFSNTLNDDAMPGNANLTVNASGATTFGQAVGGLQALTSLTTDAGGTAQVDGSWVWTTGDQTYQDAVTLGADATLTGVSVHFSNTLDSQPGQPYDLRIIAGLQGVTFGGAVGNAPGGLGVLKRIDVQTEGVLTIVDGVVLRTSSGAVSNAPPRLNIGERFPDRPLGQDGLQQLTGTVGGIGAPNDNTEFGRLLTLTVTWGDQPPESQTVNAGEQVQFITDNAGTRIWNVNPPPPSGPPSGPIEVNLTLAFSPVFVFEQAAGNAGVVATTITLANDPSISLVRILPDLTRQNLGVTTLTVFTPPARQPGCFPSEAAGFRASARIAAGVLRQIHSGSAHHAPAGHAVGRDPSSRGNGRRDGEGVVDGRGRCRRHRGTGSPIAADRPRGPAALV